MEISTTMEVLALSLTFVVHVLGAGVLVWNLRDTDSPGSWRDWWPRDEQPLPPAGPVGPPTGLPAFPDAVPSPVRLREPGHIGDGRVPGRRPAHPPVPERAPARTR